MASDLLDVIAGFFGGQYTTIGKVEKMIWVKTADGQLIKIKTKDLKKYIKKHPGARVAKKAEVEGAQGIAPKPLARRAVPAKRPVTQANIAQAMQRVPAQNRPALMQGILAQQRQNLQQGIFQPQPYGYPQQGYPAGFPVPMQQGFPGGYMQEEYFEDEPPEDLSAESFPDEDYEGVA